MVSPQESRHSRFQKAVEGLKEAKYSVESLGKQSDGAFHWTVHNSNTDYDVSFEKGKGWSCGCPDFEQRGKFLGMCKHTAMAFVASKLKDDLDAGIPIAEILDEGVVQALEQEFDEKFPIPKSIRESPSRTQAAQTPPPPPRPNGNGNGHKTAQAKGNGNGRKQQAMPPMPPMPPAPRGNGNGNGHGNGHSEPSPKAGPTHIEAQPAPTEKSESVVTPRVVAQLEQPLDPKRIKVRKGPGGTRLSYIEGQYAIAAANRIFGYGNWGYEVLSVDIDYGRKLATALVRVSVKGAMPFTDVGTADIAGKEPLKPEAIQMAIKGAATDGVKRGLKNFGDQFGLGLYFDEGTSIQQPQRTPEEAFAEVFG